MKKVIIVFFIIVLISLVIYQVYFKEGKPEFELVEVTRGELRQEISETGQVKKGDTINLGFQSSGRLEKIYVEVGEAVKEGEPLAKLDDSDLLIQLQEARASVDLAQAKLNKLLKGVSAEEIKVAETKVANAETSLNSANEDLDQAYEDAQNSLDGASLKSYNAFNTVDTIQRTYFTGSGQEDIKVRENKEKIKEALDQIEAQVDIIKKSPINENIDVALSQTKNALSDIFDSLKIIREVCDTPLYRDLVSSTHKNSLDTQRNYINTAQASVANSQQTVESMKLDVEAAQGQLQVAEDELALLVSEPGQEDIDLYKAQIMQARAQMWLLENQIADVVLRAPIDGEVIRIHKKVGEQVQPMLQDVAISLLPATPFEIEADIYEEDVVKIKIGDPVDISLVAFPDEIFKGKVIAIDPAEKVLEGVVYYEITIGPTSDLETWIPENVKPGMTADLTIITAVKENVLIAPEEAIEEKNGKKIVEVMQEGKIQEREIEIGLRGSDYRVEVVSGLKEGEKIIIRP